MHASEMTMESSPLRYHSRKQLSPLRSAQAKYTSDIMYDYMDESEPGVIFKFCLLWPHNKRAVRQLSPISSVSSSSDHSNDSNFKVSCTRSDESLSCNVSSFPFLLGQIIDHERQKRSESPDLLRIQQDTKQASGAIILASKRLQCIVKDHEDKIQSDSMKTESSNKLKPPFIYHVSMGVSSAYPDTDLEFWRSNLQKQMRVRRRSCRIFKKTNKQLTTLPKLRSHSEVSKQFVNKTRTHCSSLTILPGSLSNTTGQVSTPERRCISCGCSSTPCWRPSWYGNSGLLCNSCGLRYKKIGVRCLNKNCRHIPLRSEFREMKSKVNGNSTIDCIKCGGEVKVRG